MDRKTHLIGIWNADEFEREGADVSCILADFRTEEPPASRGKHLPFDDGPTNAILEAMNISLPRFRYLMSMRGRKIESIEVHENYNRHQRQDHLPVAIFDRTGKATLRLPEDHPAFGGKGRSPHFRSPRELMRMRKGILAIRLDPNVTWVVEDAERYIHVTGMNHAVATGYAGRRLSEAMDIPCLAPFGLTIEKVLWDANAKTWVMCLPGRKRNDAK